MPAYCLWSIQKSGMIPDTFNISMYHVISQGGLWFSDSSFLEVESSCKYLPDILMLSFLLLSSLLESQSLLVSPATKQKRIGHGPF